MNTPEELLAGKIAGFLDRYFKQKPDVLKALQRQRQAMPHPSAGSPTAAAPGVPSKPKVDVSEMTPEEREQYWREEFNQSSELKQEFMEFGIYYAFRANEYRTKTLRGQVTQ
jgi:hypothetical protein